LETIITTFITVCIAFMLAVAPVFAALPEDPRIQKRESVQQKRTAQGIESGKIIPSDTGTTGARESAINKDEARMNIDVQPVKEERTQLTKEQNRAGKKIYKNKHNDKKTDLG
jgi:hypothetical protein